MEHSVNVNRIDVNRIMEADHKWFPHFKQQVEAWHERYNLDIRMLSCPFSSPGYHTTIKQAEVVHPTRQAADYALALLDVGDPALVQRAADILWQLVSLQDTSPDSPTYGIWSWFWEEPLARMAPPDWNWADFLGKRLLYVLIRHSGRLPADLKAAVSQAVCHSCEAIIRRNVGPDYTNIAIMGAFVTLIAGEVLGELRYAEYGLARLVRLYGYTMRTGAFLEYNSPPYSTLAIVELSALAAYTRSPEAQKLSRELLELTWQMVADHFHPALKQWAGPHARSYSMMTDKARLSFLQMACGGDLVLLPGEEFIYDTEWYGQGIGCPEGLKDRFVALGEHRELRQELPPGHEFRSRMAYTYMTPGYALGTFNHNVMWNQCRNLIAYMDMGRGAAGYLALRVLHDGYDFCSAVFKSVQQQDRVLYAVQFALDGGDTHVNLDPINGRMTLSDLRIRLELGCPAGRAPAWEQVGSQHFRTAAGHTEIVVGGLHAAMTGYGPFRWESTVEGSASCLDVVLYEGPPAEMDFHTMEEALFCFVLALSAGEGSLPEAAVEQREQAVAVRLLPAQTGAADGVGAAAAVAETTLVLNRKPADRAVLFC